MLLSHTHRFIYTKTIKTAGTSVEIYFEDACLPPGRLISRGHFIEETVSRAGVIGYRGGNSAGRMWHNHMRADEIRALTGRTVWGEYFKFCVVRNPFDKLVSLWWHLSAMHGVRYDGEDFSKIRADFCAWCAEHAGVAVDRDRYLIDGEVAVDCFIRYEALLEGVEQVCRAVGFPFRPERLGTFKNDSRASRQPFQAYYDEAAAAAVEAAFRWELDYFGYGGVWEGDASRLS